jgi:hypothetical protein
VSRDDVRYVSPVFADDVDRTGYLFECSSCGWRAPVMSHFLGAERHADEHVCNDPGRSEHSLKAAGVNGLTAPGRKAMRSR